MSTGGPGHTHSFQPSGWCAFCNLRDDGRLLGKGGDVYQPGHTYSLEQLEAHRQRVSER